MGLGEQEVPFQFGSAGAHISVDGLGRDGRGDTLEHTRGCAGRQGLACINCLLPRHFSLLFRVFGS